jgi:hypothetical protein
MIVTKAIKPNRLKDKAMYAAIEKAADTFSKDILLEFEITTATWEHQVKFEREISVGPASIDILVGTDDEIYRYVDEGTRPHMIYPKGDYPLRFQSGYNAKTTPGLISSKYGGSFGDVVYARGVSHPGTKAREFDKNITKKMGRPFRVAMEKAMRDARNASGHEA